MAIFLSEKIQSRVEVGRVHVSLLGHVIADDLKAWDQKGEPMLMVTRTGAEISLQHLVTDGDIIINSVQLYGADANIYQEKDGSPYNFQYVLDAFASKDTTQKKPMPHIEVRSIMIRHTSVAFNRLWKPTKSMSQKPVPTSLFDVNHLMVSELSLTGALDVLSDDTLDVWLNRLSFVEKSGLNVTDATLWLKRDCEKRYTLEDFSLSMQGTEISSPLLIYNNGEIKGSLKAKLYTKDFVPFYTKLKDVEDVIHLNVKGDGTKDYVALQEVVLNDEKQLISLSATGRGSKFNEQIPTLDINLNKLSLSSGIKNVVEMLTGQRIPSVDRIKQVTLKGHFQTSTEQISGNGELQSSIGSVKGSGTYNNGKLEAHANLQRVDGGAILSLLQDSTSTLGNITADVDVKGELKGAGGLPEGSARINVKELAYKGYAYHGISANVNKTSTSATIKLNSIDPSVFAQVDARICTSNKNPYIKGYADIHNLDLHATHLASNSKIQRINTTLGVDFEGNTFTNMDGDLSIPHITLTQRDTTYNLTNIQLVSHPKGNERHISLTSPYLTAQADGQFDLFTIGAYVQQLAHKWLPGVVNAPKKPADPGDATLTAKVIDPTPFRDLLGLNIQLDKGPLNLSASMDSRQQLLNLDLDAPSLKIGGMELCNANLQLCNTVDRMNTALHAQRIMKETPVDLDLDVMMGEEKIRSSIKWKAYSVKKNEGELSVRGSVERNTKNGLAVYAEVLPTEMLINDTLWSMHSAQLYYRDNELYVDGFKLSMSGGERSLAIHGSASKDDEDSLFVDLDKIDLSYIFTIVELKPIALGGQVSGTLVGHNLFKSPTATGNVIIPDFEFNHADMGLLNCYLSWNIIPGSLGLKGQITDSKNNSHMNVNGDIHLVKDPLQHLDLTINCTRANAAFMNRYVSSIMDDFQGRVSGRVHIFGMFGDIDLEGDVMAHEIGLTIPSLNVRYYAYNDSVKIKPGLIDIRGIHGYDKFGKPGQADHRATINGQITYEHFRNMHYNFDITGQDILAYDQSDFGDMPFYATVYGSGNVKLAGGPGYTNIDITATPVRGTTMTYNASGPETLTQAGFVKYVDRSQLLLEELQKKREVPEEQTTNDMHINFNLNLTPEAQMRLLMDPRTGDYITAYGSSHMLATYYNKGRFQMYGTYRVDHGSYKLTLQDVIHKEFSLRKDGTIVFGGNPFDADLDVQAIYTVPSVSLNDLSARGTFSNNTVRVNCLMNIGGKAGAPRVTFDFELPNVNEEEARMVRSLISTEEERNMQVIYLLGIGRFYTYDYSATQTQSSTAMNSLLSTTLSGQINQMMSNMIGSNNWNFGANLSTGTTGWSDMDVEGMLSGRLLNNRLLINGNFGYRDNPVAQSNFIGDFDIQYLLTKNGNLILKGYSETNDRYFTKSSLTTQGVGLVLKKDYANWLDLFRFKKNKKQSQDATNK